MPDDYEYYLKRKQNKTYVSKSFTDNDSTSEPPRKLRIAYIVTDQPESFTFGKWQDEIVLYSSPKGRVQIKAVFFEDDRQLKSLIIQKFTGGGNKPQETSFCFGPEESKALVKFISNLQRIPLSTDEQLNITDTELEKILLSSDQIKRIVRDNNTPLILELARSELTASDVIALGYRKKQLERFQRLLFEPEFFSSEMLKLNLTGEALWQSFFEMNKWIFGYGLAFVLHTSLAGKRLEQMVVGNDLWGRGKRTDALLKSRGAVEALCFVEIKKHTTKLLKSGDPYRAACWAPSDDLAGGIVQSQVTVEMALHQLTEGAEPTSDTGEPTGEKLFAYQPRSYLVIGSMEEFRTNGVTNKEKYRSFELYRRNTARPEVITFDELYERAQFIVRNAER